MADPALSIVFYPQAGLINFDETCNSSKKISASYENQLFLYNGSKYDWNYDRVSKKKLKDIFNKPNLECGREEIMIYNDVCHIFNERYLDLDAFQKDNYPKVKRMIKLCNIVTPHSNNE